MSAPRPRMSSRPPRDNIIQLSKKIKEAIKRTTEGLPENEIYTCRFLPNGDLASILSAEALRPLFRELFSLDADPRSSTEDESSRERDLHPTATEDDIDSCVSATIGSPACHPRTALLALFLYLRRKNLLLWFKRWLLSSQDDLLSDTSMPFSPRSLKDSAIPSKYHEYILDYQSIFKPVTIQRDRDQTFKSGDRLPYIGRPPTPKVGSSGTVYERKIAPLHWEVMLDNERYIREETEKPTVVAIKYFDGRPTRQEAEAEFKIEREILQALRNNNHAHKMILLDWGSITIEDEQHSPISHSLIFELATFSLADFLKDERRAGIYTTKSLLLARLVDIVEAVACLHNQLKTLHLDIKSDNILVFERGSSHSDNHNQDEHELIWKLSDFGLARKKGDKQRTGHMSGLNCASGSSATPATRPAGEYQAPEIQEQNSSKAGRGSDVWSLGCLALMVLAYVTDGPTEVSKLTHHLRVEFLDKSSQKLFYVRSDTHSWVNGDVGHRRYRYLEDYTPVVEYIPGMQPPLKAAVNPQVIMWSNVLYHTYDGVPEQMFVQKWLEVVFCRVFVIAPRSNRIKAAELCDRLTDIRQRWKAYEEDPENTIDQQTITSPQLAESAVQQGQEANDLLTEELAHGDARISPERSRTLHDLPGTQERADSASGQEVVTSGRTENLNVQQPTPGDAPKPSSHSKLCLAIARDEVTTIQTELDTDPGQVKRPCPRSTCQIHPIHVAIRNRSYRALRLLLEIADRTVTDISCPRSGNRTAIAEACVRPGDVGALRCVLEYRDKFNVAENLYERYKEGLNRESDRYLKELCTYPSSQPKERSPRWNIFRQRKTNADRRDDSEHAQEDRR